MLVAAVYCRLAYRLLWTLSAVIDWAALVTAVAPLSESTIQRAEVAAAQESAYDGAMMQTKHWWRPTEFATPHEAIPSAGSADHPAAAHPGCVCVDYAVSSRLLYIAENGSRSSINFSRARIRFSLCVTVFTRCDNPKSMRQ